MAKQTRYLLPLPIMWLAAGFASHPALAQVRCEDPIGTVVSVQGTLEVYATERRVGHQLVRGDVVCPEDRIQVGTLSRAVLAMTNNEIINLDQNTTVQLPKVSISEPSLLRLMTGMVRFFSNEPRSFDVGTPFLNAGVRGTEFLVQVGQTGTYLLVYEGQVTASNPQGQVELTANQAAFAQAGAAPLVQVPVAPLDAVQWTLYYQPVLSDLATGVGPVSPGLSATLREAVQLQRQGRIAEAVALLGRAAEAGDDPRLPLYSAGLLLSVGRVEEARTAIERVLALAPESGEALGLRAVIAVARNDRTQAQADARRAVEVSPQSVAAKIALSYALQASFELEAARDVLLQAVEQQPDDALAQARLAELWLALGYRDRALQAAGRAATLAPDLGWTQIILGYTALARMNTTDAKAAFERAIALESHNPLAHLGLGLAIIREGDLGTGRRQMEIATGFAPTNAIMRSYLGKAYFEERRDEPAAEQLAFAKQADLGDPTPWFYDAIRKQTENRPVEALEDLERAIELNNNRAVYRSSLLLDEDLAVRNVGLGRIYNDLGFERRANVEASKSLVLDPANYSAHRFLSDAYAGQPRHEIARSSELLQAQLLQPLNTAPVQPRLAITDLNVVSGLGPADVGFNEFSPLFARNGLRFTGSGVFGNNGTLGEEVAVSGLAGRLSFSAGQFHYESDGFRPNADVAHNVYDIFAQAALTDQFSIQTEFRRRKTRQGALEQDFAPKDEPRNGRFDLDQDVARLGLHYAPSPHTDLIVSLIRSDRVAERRDSVSIDSDLPISLIRESSAEQEGYDSQIQFLFRDRGFNITAGAGATRMDQESADLEIYSDFPPPPGPTLKHYRVEHANAYAYANLLFPKDVTWTAGLSVDQSDDPRTGLEDSRVNPKLGVQWNITDWLRLRGAMFKTVKRPLIIDQTIEPTQVAGFNQFFDDFDSSETTRYGAGFDVDLAKNLYFGAEYSQRHLQIPFSSDASRAIFKDQDEELLRTYLYWVPHQNWSVSADLMYERIEAESGPLPEVETFLAPVSARYFHPDGFFAQVGTTLVRQSLVRQRGSPGPTPRTRDSFFVLDAAVGYRLPNRRAIVSLEVRNLLDEEFLYQDYNYITTPAIPTGANARFIPVRSILGRITFSF